MRDVDVCMVVVSTYRSVPRVGVSGSDILYDSQVNNNEGRSDRREEQLALDPPCSFQALRFEEVCSRIAEVSRQLRLTLC